MSVPGTGKGPSKKKAKHHAASQLLCNMHGIKYENQEEMAEGVTQSAASDATANGLPEYVSSAYLLLMSLTYRHDLLHSIRYNILKL